jgi:hypothetical protein
MTPIVDLELNRFVKLSIDVAERLVLQAEDCLGGDATKASQRVVEAWVVLNGSAVVATRLGSRKRMRAITVIRNRIRDIATVLEQNGISMITDVPEVTMAFLLKHPS